MKATVLHGENGQIIGIAKAVDLKQAGSKFESAAVIPGEGQYAVEVELTGELESMRLDDIHQFYHVDRMTSRLVKKAYAI
jgi:hypothetical protein